MSTDGLGLAVLGDKDTEVDNPVLNISLSFLRHQIGQERKWMGQETDRKILHRVTGMTYPSWCHRPEKRFLACP